MEILSNYLTVYGGNNCVLFRRFADLCKERGSSEMKLYERCVDFVLIN